MNNNSFRNGIAIGSEISTDRALLYGDGVFTSIAIAQGKALFLQQHLKRLENDCMRLQINNFSMQAAKNALSSALHGTTRAIARLSVSRSSGERGYYCAQEEPVYWVTVSDWPKHIVQFREQGINVCLCQQRLSRNPSLAGIKHCNRLEQVLARNEWHNADIQEGLMLDDSDAVIEGTMSNLFLIKDNQLFTPNLTFSGVEGIMKELVIGIAKKRQIDTITARLTVADVNSADGIFVTNSIIGIWPINQLEQRFFKIDPLIRLLQDELKTLGVE